MSLGGSIIHRQVKADTTDDSRVLVTAGRVREMLSFQPEKKTQNKTTTSLPWISGEMFQSWWKTWVSFYFLGGIIFEWGHWRARPPTNIFCWKMTLVENMICISFDGFWFEIQMQTWRFQSVLDAEVFLANSWLATFVGFQPRSLTRCFSNRRGKQNLSVKTMFYAFRRFQSWIIYFRQT